MTLSRQQLSALQKQTGSCDPHQSTKVNLHLVVPWPNAGARRRLKGAAFRGDPTVTLDPPACPLRLELGIFGWRQMVPAAGVWTLPQLQCARDRVCEGAVL